MLVNLQEVIKSKTTNKESEITRKLQKEIERIWRTKGTLNCQPSGNATDSKMYEKLINSSTIQYCYYQNYINYLSSNLDENIDTINTLESSKTETTNTTALNLANSIQGKRRHSMTQSANLKEV